MLLIYVALVLVVYFQSRNEKPEVEEGDEEDQPIVTEEFKNHDRGNDGVKEGDNGGKVLAIEAAPEPLNASGSSKVGGLMGSKLGASLLGNKI
jgi:hypothetical protein